MLYTLTLNPAIDYIVQLSAPLTPGGINRSSFEAFQWGGKGINVSGMLKNLGADSIALGFVAGFTGESLEKGLQVDGFTTDFIHAAQGTTRINMKVKADVETEINGSGPVISNDELAQLCTQLDRLIEGDVLVLSGSIPGCLPKDTYEQLLARMDGRGVLTVVDASGELLSRVLKYHPFLIKPNHLELGELFDQELHSDKEIAACARKLQQQGARNVLVSMAAQGALLVDEEGSVHRIGCPKGKVVNSVGAGDSMVAGFIAGWLKTHDYAYALRLGTAAGSATAFSLQLGSAELVYRLLEEI